MSVELRTRKVGQVGGGHSFPIPTNRIRAYVGQYESELRQARLSDGSAVPRTGKSKELFHGLP